MERASGLSFPEFLRRRIFLPLGMVNTIAYVQEGPPVPHRAYGHSLWHSGETIGFRNVVVRWPERRLTVIVLTNRNDPEPYALALKIAQAHQPAL